MHSVAPSVAIADLPSLFENPLVDIAPSRLKGDSAIQKELAEIAGHLEAKTDWEKKCDALKRIMSIIKAGGAMLPSFDLTPMIGEIARGATDPRSAVVRWSTMCIAAIAQSRVAKFPKMIEVLMAALFKQTSHGTMIISECCRLGILQIVTHSETRATLQAILSRAEAKSSDSRMIVAQAISAICNRWISSNYQTSLDTLKSTVERMTKDKDQRVRAIARVIDFDKPGVQVVTPRKNESLWKTVRGRSPPPKAVRLSESMRVTKKVQLVVPRNKREALATMEEIQRVLDAGPLTAGTGGHAICNAIPSATSLLPRDPRWRKIVPTLLSVMKDEMTPMIPSLIVKLRFDTSVVGKAISVFGLGKLISMFDRNLDAITLASVVLSDFPNIKFGKAEIQLMKKRCANEEDVPEIVMELFEYDQESLRHVLGDIIKGLRMNAELGDVIKRIQSAKTVDFEGDVRKHSQDIVELFNNESRKIVGATLKFIEKFLVWYSDTAVDALIMPLLELVKDETSPFPPSAERCLMKLFKTTNLEETISPLITNEASDVMILVQKYLESVSPREVERCSGFLPKSIAPLFNSSVVRVRRAAVASFARFSCVLGSEFDTYIESLPILYRKLVTSYSRKAI